MVAYISNPNNNFFNNLKSGCVGLPDEICNKCGNGLKSLSSKVCKYLFGFFQYTNTNGGDNKYYINDSYIRHALLFYLDYYGVNKVAGSKKLKNTGNVDSLSYKELHHLLSELHKARDIKHNDGILTKTELDHIIWYCYKSFTL